MSVLFPNLPGRYTRAGTVAFDAHFNGDRVICEISATALFDHFGALSLSGVDLVAAFERNRSAIEATARAIVPERSPKGQCVLVAEDF